MVESKQAELAAKAAEALRRKQEREAAKAELELVKLREVRWGPGSTCGLRTLSTGVLTKQRYGGVPSALQKSPGEPLVPWQKDDGAAYQRAGAAVRRRRRRRRRVVEVARRC